MGRQRAGVWTGSETSLSLSLSLVESTRHCTLGEIPRGCRSCLHHFTSAVRGGGLGVRTLAFACLLFAPDTMADYDCGTIIILLGACVWKYVQILTVVVAFPSNVLRLAYAS